MPKTIKFYNNTKCGVDVADQMARKYTVKSGSRRWPLQIFFNILDLAAINAWILYNEKTKENILRKFYINRFLQVLKGASEFKAVDFFVIVIKKNAA